MSPRPLNRVLSALCVAVACYALTYVVQPLSDLISLADLPMFGVAAYVSLTAWTGASKTFTEKPWNPARLASLGIVLVAAATVLLAVNSVKWRAFGQTTAVDDTLLRFGIRCLYTTGFGCLAAAPEMFERQPGDRPLRRIAIMLTCVVLLSALGLYAGRLRALNHDVAEAPATSSGSAEEP